MFKDVIEFYKNEQKLSDDIIYNLLQVNEYYNQVTPKTRLILTEIKNKYTYSKRNLFAQQPDLDTHLEFWRGSGDYNVTVSLADETGVYDADSEFGCFISDWNYENFQIMDDESENTLFYTIRDTMFYTWLAYLWQTIKGDETLLTVKVIENNSSSMFSLNDYAWEDLSNFTDFRESPSVTEKYFNRELLLAEIYSRADFKFKYVKIECKTRAFAKGEFIKKISLNESHISIETYNVARGETLDSFNIQEPMLKKIQKTVVVQMNELLNSGWEDISYTIR